MFFTLTFPSKVQNETKSKGPGSFSLPSSGVQFYIKHLLDLPAASAVLWALPLSLVPWMVLPSEETMPMALG